MILDLSESGDTGIPAYDICIVGSGPAGVTIANELRDASIRVCVLESGKLKSTEYGDRLRKVQSDGIQIKDDSRERIAGGASTSWAGLSSTMDVIDMMPRDYLGHSGWPLGRDDLLCYYDQASQRYRFPPVYHFTGNGMQHIREGGDRRLSWERLDEKIFVATSPPQNFWREFRHIFDGQNPDLYLDATLIRLEDRVRNGRITHGIVMTSKGDTLEIGAKVFVLATGGIENARILLNSTDTCDTGLGNEHDQVGRYMMNHPKGKHGIIKLHRPLKELPYYFGCMFDGYAGYAGLRLKEDLQREKGLMNCYVRFEPLFPWHRNEGVKAFVYLMKACEPVVRTWMKSKQGQIVSLKDYSETGDDPEIQWERKSLRGWLGLLSKVLKNIPQVSRYAYARLFDRQGLKVRTIRLRNFLEMEPDPENRLMLGDETDSYGQRVPVVRHGCSDRDKESLIALHTILGEELARNNFGRLETSLAKEKHWPVRLDASHHIGTTRMGIAPENSVVNSDCRLHKTANVFLAGSSVFPSSGCANPTYTIVALAIRLAEHLSKQFSALSSDHQPAVHDHPNGTTDDRLNGAT